MLRSLVFCIYLSSGACLRLKKQMPVYTPKVSPSSFEEFNVGHKAALQSYMRFKALSLVKTSNDDPLKELVVPQLLATNALGNKNSFRNQNCEEFKRHEPSNEAREEAEAMNMVQLDEPLYPLGKPKIACMVYGHSSRRQELRDSYATWGQDCDDFLAFTDETWEDKEGFNSPGFQTINLEMKDDSNLILKNRKAFEEVLRRVQNGELSFDFLTVSGDDAFWILPNLRQQLGTNRQIIELQKTGSPLIYGHIMAFDGNVSRTFPIGAGYVVNQKEIETYLKQEPAWEDQWQEDVAIGISALRDNVTMIHAQEPTGEHMLHLMTPVLQSTPGFYLSDSWTSEFEAPFSDNLHGKDGAGAISKHSFLFHNLRDSETRYHMFNALLFKSTCKTNEK